MYPLPKPALLFFLILLFALPFRTYAATQEGSADAIAGEWSSSHAEHVVGLPGAKAKETGTLHVSADGLSFATETSRSGIRLDSILAASAGNERVELWGTKGRLLRMAMPNGSGLLAATMMHHRIDMLTVEFSDASGGYHAAVFILPAEDAKRALEMITAMPVSHDELKNDVCEANAAAPRTVRMLRPEWNDPDVPAAYRALIYEGVMQRLARSQEIEHAYRDGEHGCPQFTVQLSVTGFKQGSQVERASMGPVGFFVGTTQMVFDVRISDAKGRTELRDQIKATVRGESESSKVAESVAKKVAKEFAASQKRMSDGVASHAR